MDRPEIWSLATLRNASLGEAVAWVTPSARAMVGRELEQLAIVSPDAPVPAAVDTLVVIGGGTLMDRAKLLRHERAGSLRLVVVPSIWGSGSEVSRFAVGDAQAPAEGKVVAIAPELVPDVCVEWPELVTLVPAARARHASGDAWTHALEALVSPIAGDDVRREAGALVRRMQAMPLTHHPDWMDCSRQACELQARSSVGLVHGIAHTLEAALKKVRRAPRTGPAPESRELEDAWGHARLCSLFLWPVVCFNEEASPKWRGRMDAAELDAEAIRERARELFSVEDYRQILPVLVSNWARVLRDPCTRTNVSVVRPRSLEYFRALVP